MKFALRTLHEVAFYRRWLPHIYEIGHPAFLTFRLHGSLPSNRPFLPDHVRSGRAFAAMDRLLGETRSGPLYLRRPDIARMVTDAIRYGDLVLRQYDLHAFVVMPNHVHVLLTPARPLPQITKSLKGGITAKRANAVLDLEGRPFWQKESFDRLVRNSAEFEKARRYIEWNPVRAGLAKDPSDFPWSSAAANSPSADSV